MKTFIAAVFLAASAALASAQATYNTTTGVFDCPIANATYCAGDSGVTNIIIRCIGFVGYPGNCNDNLAGEFPEGVNYAPCYASPSIPGVAACSKNCIVYGGSGNINGTFTIPGCVPAASSTTSSVSATTPPSGPLSTVTSTSFASGFTVVPSGAPTSSVSGSGAVNGTNPTGAGGAGGNATAVPTGPTKTGTVTGPSTFAGAANANSAGIGLVAVGFVAAYFL